MPTTPQQEKTLLDNAQTLQTAKGAKSPGEMAKLLGVAGDGAAEFYRYLFESQKQEDLTDVASDLAPWGVAAKGVSSAIGLIPPKYIQPFVKRLQGLIEQEKDWMPAVQQAAWEAVDRHPRIAAHVDEIRPFREGEPQGNAVGDYLSMGKESRELAAEPAFHRANSQNFASRLDNNLGPGLGARIRLDNLRPTTGGIFEPPSSVATHEMAHAAQDVWNPHALGPNQRYQTYDYQVNPFEVGANATADPMGGNYWARLERQLNSRGVAESIGTPERAKMLRDMNRTMANQGKQIVLDPKTRMLRIVLGR